MPLQPRTAKDLVLAPVAARIDIDLQRVRDRSHDEIEYITGTYGGGVAHDRLVISGDCAHAPSERHDESS